MEIYVLITIILSFALAIITLFLSEKYNNKIVRYLPVIIVFLFTIMCFLKLIIFSDYKVDVTFVTLLAVSFVMVMCSVCTVVVFDIYRIIKPKRKK